MVLNATCVRATFALPSCPTVAPVLRAQPTRNYGDKDIDRRLRVTSGNARADPQISAWPSEADIRAFVSTRTYFGLALQLRFWKMSESMGNHDSEVVDASSVD